MKAIIFVVVTLMCALNVKARTIGTDIQNDELNEIPRESLKAAQFRLSRQNNPNNSNNASNVQVAITAANIQSLLQSSPIVQTFLSDQTVLRVLSDPIVQGVLRNPTVQSVLGNPIMQNILFDPALQGFAMQAFLSRFSTTTTAPPTTTTTTTPIPPIATSLSPFFQLLNPPTPRTSTQSSNNFAPTRRPIINQAGRPTTQEAIMTAIILGIDELLNILQEQMVTRNNMNNRNRPRKN